MPKLLALDQKSNPTWWRPLSWICKCY